MERVEVLLEKLRQQWQDKAPYAQVLVTLQLLQEEIRMLEGTDQTTSGTRKVSVIVPRATVSSPVPSVPLPTKENEEKIVAVLQVDEQEIEAELKQIREAAERRNELARAARPAPSEKISADEREDIPTIASHLPYLPASAYPAQSIPGPTAAAQASPLTDPAGATNTQRTQLPEDGSLNEKLKPTGKELADLLQGSPVRDLRKAIGINDRYLYINELFRGNEAMFDRALKTLNDFSILQEAEYWIQRELRIKLGWKDDEPAVQQFTQLIKRRFS